MVLNYIGCKYRLLHHIHKVIEENIDIKDNLTFCDLFAGTGTVGKSMFHKYNWKIIANDIELYSYILNKANLCLNITENILKFHEKIILRLNNKDYKEGIIYQQYTESGSKLNSDYVRLFFKDENGLMIDTVLDEIKNSNLTNDEKELLYASLIIAVDNVANITSVYGSFLKSLKKTSLKNLNYKLINENVSDKNKVYQKDALDMLDNEYDIVYIDPPYNNRQYGANYGFLNIIAGLENFEIYGKTGLVKNYNKSKFSSRKTVKSQFETLINKIRAKYIIVSYSNEGIISYQELLNIFNEKGECKVYQIPHYKFISNSVKDKNKVIEYLFLIKNLNI